MKTLIPASVAMVFGLCGAWLLPPAPLTTQDPDKGMAEMMAKAKQFTQPGKHHQWLERFVGDWEVAASVSMGAKSGKPSKGKASYEWMIPGRWLQGKLQYSMMGMPLDAVSWLGYDNMKMSYVWSQVQSLDTAMLRAEGDLTPDGKTLILYGTLDEYLTGEHDKMVKYVYRFESADRIVIEVHDLPIGEVNTKVVETVLTRKS